MEEEYLGISDYLAILKRRKKQLVIPALVILIMSAGLAFGLPSVYRSEATILIEQQEIPSELVRSTVTSYAGERIQVISQRVMTTENLGKIIDAYGLYEDKREEASLTLLVEMMREEIGLEIVSADVIDPRSGRPTTATIAFKLSFNSKNPRISQKVTSELASLYLSENLRQRERSAVETSSFLAAESEKLNDSIGTLENRLASFKEQNFNKLPELQQLNIQLLERNERALSDTEQQIRALQERIIYLQSELAQMNPTSVSYSADGKRIYGTEDRLMLLHAEYVSLSTRYTEDHPTLIKMKEEIEALQRETGTTNHAVDIKRRLKHQQSELKRLKRRYSYEHPDIKTLKKSIESTEVSLDKALAKRDGRRIDISRVDNPAYVQLQTQLKAAEGELDSLEVNREDTKEKIKDFEERLLESPQVEREYRNLSRDYENALAKYQEIKNKQLEAELSESLERERKGERFSLVEPPVVPEVPDKPDRVIILLLGSVFSLVGGLVSVSVCENIDDSVYGIQGIVDITKTPPLAIIPYINSGQDITNNLSRRRVTVFIFVVVTMAGFACLHLFIMPLDVLLYVILRKAGIELQS